MSACCTEGLTQPPIHSGT